MKIFRLFAIIGLMMVLFTGCETYGDQKVEYSPIYPLCGEWKVTITNTSNNTIVATNATIATYNTESNSTSEMWLRINVNPTAVKIRGKVTCSPSGKVFNVDNGSSNLIPTNPTFTVTEGAVSINTFKTKTGGTADEITFKLKSTLSGSVVYLVKGYRRSMWLEDEQ